MSTHTHLTPDPSADQDPEIVAAIAHEQAIRDGLGPKVAMERALQAAGVVLLEERVDELLSVVADLEDRNLAALAGLNAVTDFARTATGIATRAGGDTTAVSDERSARRFGGAALGFEYSGTAFDGLPTAAASA